MPITYDITTDLRYLEGFEIGFRKGLEIAKERVMQEKTNEMVRRLLIHGGLSIEIIASVANITVEQVRAIAADLTAKIK